MKSLILLKYNQVELPRATAKADAQILGTLFSNLASYGYAPSKEAVDHLTKVSTPNLKTWWAGLEPLLKEVTGANRNMGDHVVYKNFPKEVLEMSQAQYWVAQILMYWGLPNELFTTDAQPRDSMLEKLKLKVLQPAKAASLQQIFSGLLKSPSRWTGEQLAFALFLLDEGLTWSVPEISFKENMVLFVAKLIDAGKKIKIGSATDVLRLAVGLSGGDVSMTENSEFKSFSKPQRRYLLNLLDKSTNLEEDMARDKERWKRFLKGLHPNDYRVRKGKSSKPLYANVAQAYNQLYIDKVISFSSEVENAIKKKDRYALELLSTRPGEFVRRLNQTMNVYGRMAVETFEQVIPKLKTVQLLKLRRYLATLNTRKYRTVAPQGNWTKLQVLENKTKQPKTWLKSLDVGIESALKKKLKSVGSVNLSESAALVKLQTNDAELAPYGRGTTFPIPDNVQFLRTASYWRVPDRGYVWFDNGFNFFDADWKAKGTLCWNQTNHGGAAVFSGDPTNTKDSEGRACQMIDLYLEKLAAKGIRYAVWNILCFSRIKFSEAEVFAAFQWGEEAQKGKLFEASRAQFAFPVSGDTYTKYVLYVDVVERKIVYMDANLKSNTSSAANNEGTLEKTMPAFVEYLDTLPSVHDLFSAARKSKTGTVVTYSDENVKLNGESAYVFRPQNQANKFKPLELNALLTS